MTLSGKKIQMFRKAAGLGQKELAAKLGVAQTTVSFWENEIQTPSATARIRLCEALGIPLEVLLEEASEYKAIIVENLDHMPAGAVKCIASITTMLRNQ